MPLQLQDTPCIHVYMYHTTTQPTNKIGSTLATHSPINRNHENEQNHECDLFASPTLSLHQSTEKWLALFIRAHFSLNSCIRCYKIFVFVSQYFVVKILCSSCENGWIVDLQNNHDKLLTQCRLFFFIKISVDLLPVSQAIFHK